MGVQCTTMVVDKVSVVIILFIVLVSVPVGFRVLLGMLERIRSTRNFSSGTKGYSNELHQTLIPSVERPADAQFQPTSDCAQGRADILESGCSMSEQGGPCPLSQMVQGVAGDCFGSVCVLFVNDFPFSAGIGAGVGPYISVFGV